MEGVTEGISGVTLESSTMLVIGGARSGKSAFAQAQAEASGLDPVFVATAQAFDPEMERRIAAHVAARDARWQCIEAPFDLRAALREAARPGRILVVDCLTLWLTNVMLRGDDVAAAGAALCETLADLSGPAIFVSNETGAGIVPDNALARQFRDEQGRLNQAMARVCETVVVVTAGLPQLLKPVPELKFHFRR